MCGIVGVVSRYPDGIDAFAVQMRDSIAHRGPDDSGLWKSNDGKVFLGSRRLAILDLSPSGHQPMQDDYGKFVIVFNGEIYNYVEIRQDLVKRGFRFKSTTDTEVLMSSYQAWGVECLSRLNGMYAFAIWDETRRELFVARDRFGEKPFYYFLDRKRESLLFASEIKALLASGRIPVSPNRYALYRYLVHHEISHGQETLFEGISALPASHALVYSPDRGALKVWRYWDLNPEAEVRLDSDEAYAERVLETLTDAVRIRLRSDVPVGSSLSGGLDSSTIVGLVAPERRGNCQATFSARFDDPRFDEGFYIERVTAKANVESHAVYPNPALVPDEMERMIWHHDQPFYSSSVYAQWNVMRLARDSGVVVLLDGQGGDEVFAGYHFFFGPYLRDMVRRFRIIECIKTLINYLKEYHIRSMVPAFAQVLPPSTRAAVKRFLRPVAVDVEFARQFGCPATPFRRRFNSPLKEELHQSLTRSVLPELLHCADRNSMAFSREIRLPFLDHRLVELVMAYPNEQKIRGTVTKVVLRNAIRGIVPEEVRIRKDKLGYAPPEEKWLRGPLRPWVEEVFHSPSFRKREWVDGKSVDRLWRGFLGGLEGWHTLIWKWLSLEYWARVFLDSGGTMFRPYPQPATESLKSSNAVLESAPWRQGKTGDSS